MAAEAAAAAAADRGDEKIDIEDLAKVEKLEAPTSDTSSELPLDTNEDAHLSLKQSLSKWRRVALYSLCMTSGILMFGYDYVIVGTVSAMPSFQYVFLSPVYLITDDPPWSRARGY